jgi:hypothetical protein
LAIDAMARCGFLSTKPNRDDLNGFYLYLMCGIILRAAVPADPLKSAGERDWRWPAAGDLDAGASAVEQFCE